MLTVYYRSSCPFCQNAIAYIKKKRLTCVYRDIDDYGGKDNVFKVLKNEKRIPRNYNTVPVIFDNGQFIGGYNELIRLK
jgi:glutaredoxin